MTHSLSFTFNIRISNIFNIRLIYLVSSFTFAVCYLLPMSNTLSLASENYAGIHPAILQAIINANTGHVTSYGNDPYSMAAIQQIRQHFGEQADVHFVCNGTGANVFSLSVMTRSFHAVLCSDLAHVLASESTAVEAFTGCRLLPVQTKNGKIIPEALAQAITRIGDTHYPQAKVLTITQPTEYGTVYTPHEMAVLVAMAKSNNLYIHIDGARLFNAAAALETTLEAVTAGAGIISLGGTKAGLMFGEAVVFLDKELYEDSRFLLKRSMQLASKMRFISCQFEAMLKNNLWRDIAMHTNNMAQLLAGRLQQYKEIKITQPVDTNAVFAIIPPAWNEPLQSVLPFYVWDETINEVRWMCSFDLQPEHIDSFCKKIETLANKV